MALKQFAEARRSWQDLLAAHEDDKSERVAEAAYNIALTYQLPTPPDAEALNLGVSASTAFVKRFPHTNWPARRIFSSPKVICTWAETKKPPDGWLIFSKTSVIADRPEVAEARRLSGRALLLQKKFDEAIAAWQEYLSKHPTHKHWSDVQRAIIDAQYAKAAERYEQKKYDDAAKLWQEFLAKYPLDGRNRRIMFLFGQMNFAQQKWNEAISDWRRLVSKFRTPPRRLKPNG